MRELTSSELEDDSVKNLIEYLSIRNEYSNYELKIYMKMLFLVNSLRYNRSIQQEIIVFKQNSQNFMLFCY